MTLPTDDNRELYAGNDSTTVFDVAFKFFRDEDLEVTLTDVNGVETLLDLSIDYTVDGAGDEDGGAVNYPVSGSPLATGEFLTILRVVPITQETDLRNQGAYYPEVVENEFDKSRMVDQQLQEQLSRTMQKGKSGIWWDAQNLRIINMAAGIAGTDATTLGQVQSYVQNILSLEGGGSGQAGATPDTFLFTGDGVETRFSVPGISVADSGAYTVTIDGLDQRPDVDYTIDLLTEEVVFGTAPPDTSVVMVRVFAYQLQVLAGLRSTLVDPQITLSAAQQVVTLSTISYIPGTNNISVFQDGLKLRTGIDYAETSSTSITLANPASGGELIDIYVGKVEEYVDLEAAILAAQNAQAAAETAQQEAEDAAGYKLGINTQSGTSYTLVASDEGDLVRMTNSGANTVTVPTNASVAFEVGTIVNIRQSGTGTTTVNPDTGVTINAPLDEFTTDGEEFGVAIVKVATDEWDLVKSYAGVRDAQFESMITASAGSEGFQKLPSGLILQWGQTPVLAIDQIITVNLPTAFPNSIINAQAASIASNTGDEDIWARFINLTNSSFDVKAEFSGGTASDGVALMWFAIGV